jgi:predicted nucleic acid-binding protein
VRLVDTSVWVDHLVAPDPELVRALNDDEILTHPWVLGELSLVDYRRRKHFLIRLSLQSEAAVVEDSIVLKMIETHRLHDCGLSWVDCQLLASAKAMQANLWTHDNALKRAWERVFRS